MRQTRQIEGQFMGQASGRSSAARARSAWAAGAAMAVLVGALAAAHAAAPTPPGGIPVVVGTLDFHAEEGSAERAESMALLETFPAAPAIIYLDLAIAPKADLTNPDAPKLDFSSTLYGPDGQAKPDPDCALGGSRFYGGEAGTLSVMTGGIYPHLALDVQFAGSAAAPFNALSCAYAPSMAGQVVLRVVGFFVVQDVSIPTARVVRLVPYTPPYEQALDALARSHADP